ncbi:MAG: hypothetical protein H6Q25_1136 [Bacteroidetes bacterium]|nr:hypothetical protein [Bacteroidota bacterium]
MNENKPTLEELYQKLESLDKKQKAFTKEINELKYEIFNYRPFESPKAEKTEKKPIPKAEGAPRVKKTFHIKSNIEKIIGENLINKIGIIITVIGVAIGAKYSIEHDLITPLARIILGYLTGIALFGLGIRLKKNYENYSAVLVSGAIAIIYFITYAAYNFYSLLPQVAAFLLMVVFTVLAVITAMKYNKQVIALIGLVGAYAVPFLLSEGSGKVAILFTYMAIINVGILVIAFKKYWKWLYYTSFGLSWIIFFSWKASKYIPDHQFALAFTFLIIFFIIFYVTFLAYKLVQKEKFNIENIILLLANSFFFYGIGYSLLTNHNIGDRYLGVFTLCNAVIHFIVCAIIYRQKLADKNLFYFILGLVLVFITITIPVQLNGSWVTLLWAGEAAALFWIGRTKKVAMFEILAYPLMVVAFFSIIHDWFTLYSVFSVEQTGKWIMPVFNIYFLSSLFFIFAFGYINFLYWSKESSIDWSHKTTISNIIKYGLPTILLITLYFAIRLEITSYWSQLYSHSAILIEPTEIRGNTYLWDQDLLLFKSIWVINYSILFFSVLSFINFKKIKNRILETITFGLLVLSLIIFLTEGLLMLSGLRETYLVQPLPEYYHSGIFNILIRYISFLFVAVGIFSCFKYIRREVISPTFRIILDAILYISIIWIASSELIHWMDMAHSTQIYKIGLSILWGVYSLLLIIIGIWKSKQHIRIGAIALFGITLLKLFFYDIKHLDTIPKTILFISLGILLLIISFLYNKYKHLINDRT